MILFDRIFIYYYVIVFMHRLFDENVIIVTRRAKQLSIIIFSLKIFLFLKFKSLSYTAVFQAHIHVHVYIYCRPCVDYILSFQGGETGRKLNWDNTIVICM